MGNWNPRAAVLAAALVSAALGARAGEYVDTLVWNTAADKALFPELLPDAPAPAGWVDKPSFGIAFSGGGTRAGTAAIGQLRALVALGWFERVRYVSSVSGGTWGSLPFTYLPAGVLDRDYLGDLVAPGKLQDSHFKAKPPKVSAAWAMSHARLLHGWLAAARAGEADESSSVAVGKAFLEPLGLDGKRSFAWSLEHARRIAARNSLCYDPPAWDATQAEPRKPCVPGTPPSMRAEDFYLPREGRPFHIVNASLLVERNYAHISLAPDSKFPVQLTPYYSGVGSSTATYAFKSMPKEAPSQMPVGGTLVESFAFDTWPPLRITPQAAQPGGAELYRAGWRGPQSRFTLSDVVGTSGAAPQQATSALGARNWGFPEFHHWAMDRSGRVDRPFLHERAHGDGGHVDNLGVGALLERGVRNIIVFASMPYSFDPEQDFITHLFQPLSFANSLVGYFVPPASEQDERKGPRLEDGRDYLLTGIAGRPTEACGDDRLNPCALQDLTAAFKWLQSQGRPLVHCQAYSVNKDNLRFRTQGFEGPVNICWVYLDRKGSRRWLTALNPQLSPRWREPLTGQTGDFNDFPNYRTFVENPSLAEAVQLKPAQVMALSQLTSWSLCVSAAQIARAFPELDLPLRGCEGIPTKLD
jgi:hypothetical protein